MYINESEKKKIFIFFTAIYRLNKYIYIFVLYYLFFVSTL